VRQPKHALKISEPVMLWQHAVEHILRECERRDIQPADWITEAVREKIRREEAPPPRTPVTE